MSYSPHQLNNLQRPFKISDRTEKGIINVHCLVLFHACLVLAIGMMSSGRAYTAYFLTFLGKLAQSETFPPGLSSGKSMSKPTADLRRVSTSLGRPSELARCFHLVKGQCRDSQDPQSPALHPPTASAANMLHQFNHAVTTTSGI